MSTSNFPHISAALGEKKTRHIGFCPVCEGHIKVRGGRLVHHGYLRPGKGYIVGDCFGVGLAPHETSVETAKKYLREVVTPFLADLGKQLAYVSGSPKMLPFFKEENGHHVYEHGKPVMITRTRDDVPEREWEQRRRVVCANIESDIRYWDREKLRIGKHIESWKPEALVTVEEDARKKDTEKAERKAAKQTARDSKVQEAVLSLQKRIDSAVKNKRPGTIQTLFSDGYRKINSVSGGTIRRNDAIKLVDRDHVWRAFGLIRTDGSYVSHHEEIYGAFDPWNPYKKDPAPFPAALGGGKAKI